MATFTTWAALVAAIKDDIASGNWRTKSYEHTTAAGSRTHTFRDLKEITGFYTFAKAQADEEAAGTGQIRTCAKLTGSGGLF